ncbi:methyl-accepting chemotaxis protein [Haloplanus aerogenes]|uniref:Methyl-accepting chemotaxis protein n=1 Tax=Haloplanus aerogenes TaxID=660522 RepID=A0A3M0D1J8_9EURY|nr:methyl-accepting chemotaxis protein [Haloplanus aerogenes]AZH23904.1 PAS domain-containing protein [Haloplanus aerogenes]RMB13336.1 methyl-accepting chemotaxis protein [Haloplanus aerogenes]
MSWLHSLFGTDSSARDARTDGGAAGVTVDPVDEPQSLDVTLNAATLAGDDVPAVREDLRAAQADHLAAVAAGETDADESRDLAEQYATAGVGASGFAASYGGAVDELVTAAFDMVRDGEVEAAEEALRRGLDATLSDAVSGLTVYDELADGDAEYADALLTIEAVLEAIPYPIYMLDANNRVIGWNYGHTALVGMDREEAIGKTAQESVVKATYSAGARKLTLADKVIEAPYRAHEEFDVEKVDTPYSDHHVYKDTSTASTLDEEEIEIVFWAVPMFDDDGNLLAVFEMLDDRTEEVRRKEAMESLVGEVTATLEDLGNGSLTARAAFDGQAEVVDDELLDIVGAVNEMAGNFQSLVGQVDDRTEDLADSIEAAAEAAERIDDQLDEQNASLQEAAEEMDDFSATMEEIAATSNEVATAAEQARSEVETGIESARDAREVADAVNETSEELVDTVSELSARMDEIEQVVEVIADVADQTNLLALNANIEAARAGEAGSGFGVVADQVKDLADETQSHTDEIAGHIERIKSQSRETVSAVEASHQQVDEVDTEIRRTVGAFEEISDAVETAAIDIEEVADANDDQAVRIEGVTSMIREAREATDLVAETADAVVDETATQQEAVEALEARVDELSE